jgi:MOSC domain-containing protein YiiM
MLEKNISKGKVIKVCKCEKRSMLKKVQDKIKAITNYGIEGDYHAGKGHRQVSLLSEESLQKIIKEKNLNLKEGYCNFAQNITFKGIELYKYPVGTKFRIGKSVLLEITEIGKAGEINPNNIMLTEGIFAKVLEGGTIFPEDNLKVLTEQVENND